MLYDGDENRVGVDIQIDVSITGGFQEREMLGFEPSFDICFFFLNNVFMK
jgi:hypothetical protein